MSTGIWSAASGAVAQQWALDVTANNLANSSSPGYRADRAVFRQELARAVDGSEGTRSMRFATSRTAATDQRAGNIVQTGRPLDVAVRDPNAFFVVGTPEGVRYTRDGSFQLASDGTLRNRDGFAYIGPNGKPLSVAAGAQSVAITVNGDVTVNGEANGTRLHMVSFRDVKALEKQGTLLFRARPEAGAAVPVDPNLAPSSLEMSNASPLEGMTNLVSATRHFDMVTRVIEAFSNADRKAATNLMGR